MRIITANEQAEPINRILCSFSSRRAEKKHSFTTRQSTSMRMNREVSFREIMFSALPNLAATLETTVNEADRKLDIA